MGFVTSTHPTELVHGAPVSIQDPARFAFVHGGKDGHPYPMDCKTYDQSIQTLHTAVEQATRSGGASRWRHPERLATWSETTSP